MLYPSAMQQTYSSLQSQVAYLNGVLKEKDIKNDQNLCLIARMSEAKYIRHCANIEEKRKLHEIVQTCSNGNKQLRLELETQRKELERCNAQNKLEKEKLDDDNQKLKRRLLQLEEKLVLANKATIDTNLELKKEVDAVSFELEEKADKIQDMESLNQSLSFKLQMTYHELQGAYKNLSSIKNKLEEKDWECIALTRELQEKFDELHAVKSGNHELLVKEGILNDMLQGACQELISVKHKLEKKDQECNALTRELQEKIDEIHAVKSGNHELLVKEGILNDMLQGACQELTSVKKKLEEKDRECKVLVEERISTDKLSEVHQELISVKNKLEEKDIECNALTKQLEEEVNKIHALNSVNQILLVKEQISSDKLIEAHQELRSVKNKLDNGEVELNALRNDLVEKNDETQALEALNQTLVIKERISTNEIQEARRELITGLPDFLTPRTNIGIKRMGELNQKPFRDACLEKIPGEDLGMKSAELCSLWETNIQNPQWHPFKRIRRYGKFNVQEVEDVDDNDGKLKELKDVWGEQVYQAVSVALLEINEYNPSGRYPVQELWNFKESRKSNLKEVTCYLLKQLKSLKTLTKSLKRRG